MLPDRAVRRVSALKLEGRLLGALLECLVNLGFSAGCRGDFLKLWNQCISDYFYDR